MKFKTISFLTDFKQDIADIEFDTDGDEAKLTIGKFSMSRSINGNSEYAVKKLFEDFMTNTFSYYIRNFWNDKIR